MPITNKKMIISGNTVELYEYEQSIMYGVPSKAKRVQKLRIVKPMDPVSLYRTKNRLGRILECNVNYWTDRVGRPYQTIFVTLTFAENITDLTEAHRRFTNFIGRINYLVYKEKGFIKYLVVPEFQKRGAVHYHTVFFNLPFVENIYDQMRETWSHGFVIVKSVYSIDNLLIYLSKYLSKQNADERFWGRKKYFCSRGLKRPVETRNEELVETIMPAINSKPIVSTRFGRKNLDYENIDEIDEFEYLKSLCRINVNYKKYKVSSEVSDLLRKSVSQ